MAFCLSLLSQENGSRLVRQCARHAARHHQQLKFVRLSALLFEAMPSVAGDVLR